MDWKLGYGTIGLIALTLTAGLVWYEVANAPPEIPVRVSYSSAPLLDPYPELEGLVVHLNTASRQELEQLPGIGPTKAENIRAYVRAYGPIERLEQLLEVDGVGEKTLENIRPYLSLD